jgi:hypothetical protein
VRTHRISRALGAWLLVLASMGTFSAGCSVDNALVGGTCAAGYTQCGLHCVKLSSDPQNCGACGQACRSGSACSAGSCGPLEDATTDGATDAKAGEAAAEGSTFDAADSSGDEGSGATDSSSDDGSGDATAGDADRGDAGSSDATAGDSGADDSAGSLDGSGEGPAGNPDSDNPDSADGSADDSSAPDSGVADSAPDQSASDSSGDDSGDAGEAGNPCTPPLAYCGGQCIDVTGDPVNCGACNVVCASQLCTSSLCVGAASGGIVYIGHDYTTTLAGTAQARVLSNAVFIPGSNPLHVLSYERYASASGITHVDAILNGVATQLGRTLSITRTSNDNDVPAQLVLPTYDVLLVHDQSSAPDAALGALGSSWAATLTTFTLGGGVVVVLDGGRGIGQMPAFASGTGLLTVGAHSAASVGTPLIVSSRLDAVANGVISPYGAGQNSVSLSTEANGGNVVYVVELANDAGTGAPVVVHKAF